MSEETEIWSEQASMLDFTVNPMQWIFTIITYSGRIWGLLSIEG